MPVTINNNIEVRIFGDVLGLPSQTILANQGILGTLGEVAILGKSTVLAGTITADGGNTGDGTFTALALAAGGPAKIGAYNIECVEAITNSGRFKLVDPDGVVLSDQIIIPAGAGNLITPIIAGITFTITDASADFIVGDKAAITVLVGTGKLILTLSTAVDGSEIPAYIIQGPMDTGVADIVRDVVERGKFNENFIELGGSDTLDTIVNNKTIREYLREKSLFAVDTKSINK